MKPYRWMPVFWATLKVGLRMAWMAAGLATDKYLNIRPGDVIEFTVKVKFE